MTVVYVDSVFVLNALMDYLLVLCAARLAGIPLRRRRYLLAGLLGGGKEQTQKEVADQLGISQSYISRLEKRIISRLKKEILRLS